MKLRLLLLIFLPTALFAQSGILLPQRENSRRIDLAVSPTGDRIVIGEVVYRSVTSIDLDPGTDEYRVPAFGENAGFGTFVASYSPAGELNWAFPISDPEQAYNNVQAHYVETDAAGNIYVKGQYYGQADFDPTESVFPLTAAAANEDGSFIASYTPAGSLRFALDLPKHTVSTFDRINFRQFGVDAAGNSYTFLFAEAAVDYDPGPGEFIPAPDRCVLVSYDREGAFRFGFSTLRSVSMLGVAPTGAFYLVGSFRREDEGLDLDPGEDKFVPEFTADSIHNVLLAYGADQELQFMQGFAGMSLSPYFVDGDRDGNVYFGADYYPGTTDVAPGPDEYLINHAGEQGMEPDLLLVKYAPDGSVLRGFILEDRGEEPAYEFIFDHALTEDGRLLLSGFISGGTVDFNPGATEASLVDGAPENLDRSFVAAYDADLNLEFAYSMEGTDATTDKPAGPLLQIAATSVCGDYALLGNVNLPLAIDYDPGEGTLTPEPGAPTTDSIGLLLLNQYAPGAPPVADASCDRLSPLLPGIRTSEVELSAVPNPSADGFFDIRLPFPLPTGGHYRVTDAAGRSLLSGRIRTDDSAETVHIDLGGAAPGMYFFEFFSAGVSGSARLLRSR